MDQQIEIVLRYALAREVEGREFYKSRLERISSHQLKQVFEQLVQMEQSHVDYISDLLKTTSISQEVTPHRPSDFEIRELEESAGDIDSMTDLSILRMAYLIEHDFAVFYENAAKNASDESIKNALLELSSWEKSHREALRTLYDEAMRNFWYEQGFSPIF
ncbi:MAG TPA: ferritin family protein [Pseudothermotoga sp.]|nr:ferritin family protein [Pseudothermotoga sp.]HOK82823.1 ferritin family protein [Pseudothermotoga sp.]HPP70003.1 ferritin family protein [Pseudothermotoga sp.]